jgi:YjbE family integral membrane protein
MELFYSQFLKQFLELFTLAGAMVLLNIILIDIVMSGDNAILIGMATRKLQGSERKKAIFLGITLATIFRIVLAFFAVFLLSVVGVKFAGGLLLLYVVWKFYRELRMPAQEGHHIDAKKAGLMAAISTIIIADFSMSLDNVLAVAGAAHENIAALGIGLVFSIALMAFASHFIAKYLDKYPGIQWVGLFVILFVAEMILSGTNELETKFLHMNILPFVLFILGGLFFVLHARYIQPADEKKLSQYLQSHTLQIISIGITTLFLVLIFGGVISIYIQSHHSIFYSILFILFFSLLEIISLVKMRRKKQI